MGYNDPIGSHMGHIGPTLSKEKACQSREREVHAELHIRPARSDHSWIVGTRVLLHRHASRTN